MGSSIHVTRLMRARINDRLARAARYQIAVIVAPAGFGKSVALRDFIETARVDAVRYDVLREEGTLLAFVRGLSEALAPVAPSLQAAFPAMQQRVLALEDPLRHLSDWFAEHLKRTVCTIVIDDLHHAAADPTSIALLGDLIERTHERIAWILATRSDVGLPIGTWLGYGRMDLPVGEDELRFTPEEALAAAQEAPAPIDAQEVETLRALTEGWPIALSIALRTRTHAADLRTASAGTREMVYRYLAEQSFASLGPADRHFLLSTCVFPTFDAGIADAYGATPGFIEELRRNVTFLSVASPDEYRYHDLFREFLESELRRLGGNEWTSRFATGGALLEKRGERGRALALYTKAGDPGAILRIFEGHAFELFERGEAAALTAALDAVPADLRGASATALGVRAMLEASRGRFDLAERSYAAAIERAEQLEIKTLLVHRFAIELVRHERDCIPLLEPYALDKKIAANLRVPMLGTLATAYVRAGRVNEGLAAIRRALDLLEPAAPDDVRARLLQQAAYVYHVTPSRDQARTYAEHAIELALARNLYDVAARAYSILYTIQNDEADDPIASLSILDKLEECARKGASEQARLYSLIASYEIEVERGDDAAIERIEPALEEHHEALARARGEALLPARALRAAWNGEFRRAYDLLAGTAEAQSSPERRALRAAEIALYAAAAGMNDEAEAAMAETQRALETSEPQTRRAIRSRLFLALVELARGHGTMAHRHLAEAERSLQPSMRRLRALANAVRALYRVHLEQGDSAPLAGALERMRSEHFGGLARLLSALPVGASEKEGYAQLTPAEREILQLLVGGASTKDVAAKTTRSPQTVDTHIRSLCRKLHCSGRREAVALAIRSGWVDSLK
jgi:LuxR family maltose regulon positive regulatory protein